MNTSGNTLLSMSNIESLFQETKTLQSLAAESFYLDKYLTEFNDSLVESYHQIYDHLKDYASLYYNELHSLTLLKHSDFNLYSKFNTVNTKSNELEEQYEIKLSDFLSRRDKHLAIEYFDLIYQVNPEESKKILSKIFFDSLTSDNDNYNLRVHILDIISQYGYQDLYPENLAITMWAISLKGDKIKTKVLDILGHWGNKESYNYLRNIDEPSSYLAKIKYHSILNSLSKKYASCAQN